MTLLDQMRESATIANLAEAVRLVDEALGVTDPDFSRFHFASPDPAYDGSLWPTATTGQRTAMLIAYVLAAVSHFS